MTNKTIKINGRAIGMDHPPYIVAELSANHNGSIDRAKQIIVAAKEAGADAVKLQSYTADTMTFPSNKDEFMVHGGLWDGKSLYELYQWAHMPWDWHQPLFDFAADIGITIFSTPFDASAVTLLESLNSPAHKIASFELTDTPLIRQAAQTGKPLIISTGMGSIAEIKLAITTARTSGCKDLIILHCVSGYPAPAGEYNLRTLLDLQQRFDVLVGLSDHTVENSAAIASVALGACFIEKHVTLDKNSGGPDDSFSILPEELAELVSNSRTAWQALGRIDYERQQSEQANLKFRRSLYVVEDIQKGATFTAENVRSIRPGFGLSPDHYLRVLGKQATTDIRAGTALSMQHIDG